MRIQELKIRTEALIEKDGVFLLTRVRSLAQLTLHVVDLISKLLRVKVSQRCRVFLLIVRLIVVVRLLRDTTIELLVLLVLLEADIAKVRRRLDISD